GSGPHIIHYDRPPKEIIVSRKCAEAVLRGAQVYVPGVVACSAHVAKGDVVTVSVGVEQPALDGGWGIGITRGTILQGFVDGEEPYHRRFKTQLKKHNASSNRVKRLHWVYLLTP
ncbi:putative methyltransferase NSUN6 isoform X5, partial [Fagus crenata]